MYTKFLALIALLGFCMITQQKKISNETVKYINKTGPSEIGFYNCSVTLVNSDATKSYFERSRLLSNNSHESGIFLYKTKVEKKDGIFENSSFVKEDFIGNSFNIRQANFINSVVDLYDSHGQDLYIYGSLAGSLNSSIEKFYVNASIFGSANSKVQTSLFNSSWFLHNGGDIQNSSFILSKVELKNTSLDNVTFIDSSICLDSTVKLNSVNLINTTIFYPKHCASSITEGKRFINDAKELIMNEDIDSGIFEGFGDNLLQALERSIDFDDELEDEEIY